MILEKNMQTKYSYMLEDISFRIKSNKNSPECLINKCRYKPHARNRSNDIHGTVTNY